MYSLPLQKLFEKYVESQGTVDSAISDRTRANSKLQFALDDQKEIASELRKAVSDEKPRCVAVVGKKVVIVEQSPHDPANKEPKISVEDIL